MVGMEKRIAIQEELGIRIFPRMQDVGMNVCRNTKARKAKKKKKSSFPVLKKNA